MTNDIVIRRKKSIDKIVGSSSIFTRPAYSNADGLATFFSLLPEEASKLKSVITQGRIYHHGICVNICNFNFPAGLSSGIQIHKDGTVEMWVVNEDGVVVSVVIEPDYDVKVRY